MTPTVAETNREIGRIRALPYSVARSTAAEQVVRRIDTEGPAEALAYALFTLVESYSFGGEPAKAYVPFARLTRLWDEHPELFDSWDRHQYFWCFKWIVSELKNHPDIPATRIEAALQDLRNRYALAGNGASAMVHQEFSWASHRGSDDADRLLQAWATTPRDDFSQCEGCTLSQQAEYHAARGRTVEAMRIVSDALASQNDCDWRTHTLAVAALLHLDLGQRARPSPSIARHVPRWPSILTADGRRPEASTSSSWPAADSPSARSAFSMTTPRSCGRPTPPWTGSCSWCRC